MLILLLVVSGDGWLGGMWCQMSERKVRNRGMESVHNRIEYVEDRSFKAGKKMG